MSEFIGSIGLFGWVVIGLAIVGFATLPRALREMWRRPWKSHPADASRNPVPMVRTDSRPNDPARDLD